MRPSDIIEFNVGGFAYTTSRTTIMSYQDSMLARMCSGMMPTATDSNSRVFIDRDGPLFRHILNYLRDKQLNLPENFSEYAQLRQEADFYRIEPLISDLDALFGTKTNSISKTSSSLSLNSLTLHKQQLNTGGESLQSTKTKGIYFTIISKLYQGSLESIIGCIRVLSVLTTLDTNSKRFLKSLVEPTPTQQRTLLPLTDSFVCECKFMQEEKIISCKPCGLTSDQSIANLSQTIIRLAKRYSISTGYWDDMFYLTFDSAIPNREQFCSLLNSKFNGKLLNSNVCEKRPSYDENLTNTLVERWYLPDVNCFIDN